MPNIFVNIFNSNSNKKKIYNILFQDFFPQPNVLYCIYNIINK